MERRELFKILAATSVAAAGASAQHTHTAARKAAAYKPRFFAAAEYEILDRLAEIIIPADDDSAGAREAGVPIYIDTVVFHADARTKEFWRTGLAGVERLSEDRFARSVRDLASNDLEHLMGALLADEQTPRTDLDRFSVRLKALVIEAYSVSDAGLRHFGYKGNGARTEFPGCTHPEHQAD